MSLFIIYNKIWFITRLLKPNNYVIFRSEYHDFIRFYFNLISLTQLISAYVNGTLFLQKHHKLSPLYKDVIDYSIIFFGCNKISDFDVKMRWDFQYNCVKHIDFIKAISN